MLRKEQNGEKMLEGCEKIRKNWVSFILRGGQETEPG